MLFLSPQTPGPFLLRGNGARVTEQELMGAGLGRAASRGPSGVLAGQQAAVRGGTLRNQASRVLGTWPGSGVKVGAAGLWGAHTTAYLQRGPPNTTWLWRISLSVALSPRQCLTSLV